MKLQHSAMQDRLFWLILPSLIITIALFQDDAIAIAQTSDKLITYNVIFEGEIPSALKSRLENISKSYELKSEKISTTGLLLRRAREDRKRIREVLRSEGYYDPTTSLFLKKKSDESVSLTFSIDTGPLYRIASVEIKWSGDDKAPEPVVSKLEAGAPARAEDVINGADIIISWLKNNGYPFARFIDKNVVVDHSTREMEVEYQIDGGRKALFGKTSFAGLTDTNELYLREKILWSEGDLFSKALIAKYKSSLGRTDIFATIVISPVPPVSEDGEVDIMVDATERLPRTVSAGVYYRTDEQFGAKASWEHRNINGSGSRLRFEGEGSSIKRIAIAEYREPHFYRPDLSLRISLEMGLLDTIAYRSIFEDGKVAIERRLTPELVVGLGGGARSGDETSMADHRVHTYLIGSIFTYANYDASDKPLDPTEGWRASLWAEPSYGENEGFVNYVKATATADIYYTFGKTDWLTLALRGEGSVIAGEGRHRIPPDLRLYLGGGGSIRGYPFLTVGPLVENIPIGGLSALSGSFELRFRTAGPFGYVLFADGGMVYDDNLPDETLEPLFGGGIGLRYFAAFAPLRLDLAFPFRKREEIDDDFQIYVGIGQAF